MNRPVPEGMELAYLQDLLSKTPSGGKILTASRYRSNTPTPSVYLR
ncbi:MAG: hypothetical protein ACOWYE_18295 [Desulfatiglandales bacterium]